MSDGLSKKKRLAHDHFVRTLFSQPEAAEEFFAKNLPDTLRPLVNLTTLTACKESYVKDDLGIGVADILFSVEIASQPSYIYTLVEHQSSPDPLMCWRMLKYMMLIQDDHLKRAHHEEGCAPKILPLVVPFVLYTGEKPWRSSMHFFDLFGALKEIATLLFTGRFPLIDVTAMDDTDLEASSLLNTSLLAMKYIRQLRQNPKLLDRVFAKTSVLEQKGKRDYANTIMTYVAGTGGFTDRKLWEELVRAAFTEDFAMNLLDQYEKSGLKKGLEKGRLEGLQTGLEKGIEKVALNLLEKGMSVEFIEEATGLSAERIQKLRTFH